MRIDDWLQQARTAGAARLDAQLLLAHHLGRPRTWLLAHGDETLAADLAAALDRDLMLRLAGRPLAYLVGEREFHGLTLKVDDRVLVPRPETEGLVDWAVQLAAALPRARVADLGTGSGAIALALAHRLPGIEVTGVDRSADALAVARDNAARLGLAVRWRAGHWWAPLAGERFDLVVANPPYVAVGDPHLAALADEPPGALVSGPEGLDDLRQIVAGAPAHLAGGAWLLLEHGHEQAAAVARMLVEAGFEGVQTRADLAGHGRLSGGRIPTG